MKKAILFFLAFITALTASAQTVAGTWTGKLSVGGTQLTVALNITDNADGTYSCTLDSPDQGVKGIPAEITVTDGTKVKVTIASLMAAYEGEIKDGEMKGTFTQGGMPFTLNLKPGTVKLNRPQTPVEPYPYATKDVKIDNKADNVSLGATLTYPVGYEKMDKKDVPVVVMVTGSGLQNRDEELFGHKPFLVLADYLARNGIATLRYDDRGMDKSTGNPATATVESNMRDALAAVEAARGMGEFGKVGVLGHSEGGLIAFMLGAQGKADFIVSMAGPGIKGDSLLAEQQNAQLRLYGKPANRTVKQVREEMKLQPKNAWLDYFADYDPASDITRTTVPVMAINGSHDMQVLAESNLGAIRKYLADGNRQNLIKEYPGLNHLFQHCQLATSLDYYRIEETCAPEVLKDIADWINALR